MASKLKWRKDEEGNWCSVDGLFKLETYGGGRSIYDLELMVVLDLAEGKAMCACLVEHFPEIFKEK